MRGLPLKPTREGYFVIAMAFLFGISAFNTGLNLIYLLFSSILSLILLSGIFGAINLAYAKIDIEIPSYSAEDEPILLSWKIWNPSFFWTIWSLEWEVKKTGEKRKDLTKGNTEVSMQKELQKSGQKRLFLASLPPRREAVLPQPLSPQKRGVLLILGFQITSYFPFGLFQCRKWIPQKKEILIFPKIYPFQRSLTGLLGRHRSHQHWEDFEGDFLTLREYIPGDPIHGIHWKTSAKQGVLMVRQEEKLFPKEVHLFLAPPSGQKGEELLRFCASLVYFCYQKGIGWSLFAEGEEIISLPLGRGKKHLLETLTSLALFQPVNKDRYFSIEKKSLKTSGFRIGFHDRPIPGLPLVFTPREMGKFLDMEKRIILV
ncbi:MAG: DUF58 domain-containing protein [Planctomycetota bacterium]|nr:MAG: DUF58 domain-containing protein [Planctomycetota bacterium]